MQPDERSVEDDLADLGDRPPIEPRPEWTVQNQRSLRELEKKLRDVMRNRNKR